MDLPVVRAHVRTACRVRVCRLDTLQEAPTDDMLAMLHQSQQARGQAGEGAPVSLEHAAVAALAASSYDLQAKPHARSARPSLACQESCDVYVAHWRYDLRVSLPRCLLGAITTYLPRCRNTASPQLTICILLLWSTQGPDGQSSPGRGCQVMLLSWWTA